MSSLTPSNTIFGHDLSFLAESAHRLEDRLRSAPSNYLTICISAAGIVLALGNVLSTKGTASLEGLLDINGNYLFVLAFLLYGLGFLRIIAFGRDRKHYIIIISTLNDLRCIAAKDLKMEGKYSTLWIPYQPSMWPPDSSSTIAVITLVFCSNLVLFTALVLFQNIQLCSSICAVLSSVAIQVVLLVRISRI